MRKSCINIFLSVIAAPSVFPQAAPAPLKLGSVTVQGSYRTRLEMWDWFDGAADSAYPFSGNILRLGLGQQGKRVDWQLEMAAPFLLGLPDNAIAAGAQGQLGLGATYFAANQRSRNAGMVFAKQGFVRVKGLFGNDQASVRLGRFEFNDGTEVVPKNASLAAIKRDRISQRLIGSFGWTHVGRSFDGAHYTDTRGKLNFTAVGALPTRGVFQADGWGNLKTGFGYAALTGQAGTAKSAGEWRLFGIYYHDWRRVVKTDNRALAERQRDFDSIRIGTFGGHYIHVAESPAGPLDLLAWGVLQTGKWGALDHRGGAIAVEGGWQPKILPRLKPWLRGGYFHGSGDADPRDTAHNTFFQILPTPRPYARTPFYDLVNNEDAFGMLTLRPHKAVTVKAEGHALRLSERNDLWFQGGGAFQPWTFGYVGRPSGGARGLATLWDVSVDWNANARVTLSGYFGYAQGKGVVRAVYPRGQDARFGYLEMTYRF